MPPRLRLYVSEASPPFSEVPASSTEGEQVDLGCPMRGTRYEPSSAPLLFGEQLSNISLLHRNTRETEELTGHPDDLTYAMLDAKAPSGCHRASKSRPHWKLEVKRCSAKKTMISCAAWGPAPLWALAPRVLDTRPDFK